MLHARQPEDLEGVAVHLYRAGKSMDRRVFVDADGELLIIPQQGAIELQTELGRLEVAPGSIGLVPRGVKFRVQLTDGEARGYVAENYGLPFRLPDLGPIGANGLANPRDFETPTAWFEDSDEPVEVVQKYLGKLWSTTLDHSPLDVVAWHGNYAPCRYDLSRFNTINTVSFDHPDPSIFTVLTSPSNVHGRANADFVIFPPRWMVGEDTFRPPWFHRNVMSEAMGLIHGAYDAKAEGFAPGGLSLHNLMSGHGPDVDSWQKGERGRAQAAQDRRDAWPSWSRPAGRIGRPNSRSNMRSPITTWPGPVSPRRSFREPARRNPRSEPHQLGRGRGAGQRLPDPESAAGNFLVDRRASAVPASRSAIISSTSLAPPICSKKIGATIFRIRCSTPGWRAVRATMKRCAGACPSCSATSATATRSRCI